MYTHDDEAEELASSDLGTDQSDQGGVGDSERIFALQDAEFEHESAEGLIEHIDQAGDDMVNVLETHAMVVESIGSNNKAQMTAALAKARGLRRHLSSRYGSHGCSLPVVESIHVPVATVFALEEEAEEEVGFLRRIFRSIANAFKWLWEKLTGVFSSNKKKDEQLEKKDEKAGEAIKAVEASPEKNESNSLTLSVNGENDSVVDWLGKDDSPAHLLRKMEELEKILQAASHDIEALRQLGRFIKEVTQATRNTDPEALTRIMISFNEKIVNIASRWPKLDKSVLKENQIGGREVANVNGFDQLPKGDGFVVASFRMGEKSFLEAHVTDGIFVTPDRRLKALTLEEMEKGRDLGAKLRKISSKLDTDFIPVMTLERDVDMAFKDFIDREMPEDKEDLKKLKEEISGSFRPMVTMVGKLIMFYGNLSNQGRAAASFMFNYIVLSSDALKIKVEDIPGEKKE